MSLYCLMDPKGRLLEGDGVLGACAHQYIDPLMSSEINVLLGDGV